MATASASVAQVGKLIFSLPQQSVMAVSTGTICKGKKSLSLLLLVLALGQFPAPEIEAWFG